MILRQSEHELTDSLLHFLVVAMSKIQDSLEVRLAAILKQFLLLFVIAGFSNHLKHSLQHLYRLHHDLLVDCHPRQLNQLQLRSSEETFPLDAR